MRPFRRWGCFGGRQDARGLSEEVEGEGRWMMRRCMHRSTPTHVFSFAGEAAMGGKGIRVGKGRGCRKGCLVTLRCMQTSTPTRASSSKVRLLWGAKGCEGVK